MSNNESSTSTQQGQTPDEIRANTQQKISELAARLQQIDETEGKKANELLNLYGALHVDPSGDEAKDDKGRTATEVYEEYVKATEAAAQQKKPLEEQLNTLSKGLGLIADYDTLRQASKERAEASKKACQEPFKDYTQYSNPELDKIRSELQKNPLPGGNTASIDDGTGGEGQQQTTTVTTTEDQSQG